MISTTPTSAGSAAPRALPEDRELLLRSAAGDSSAFSALFQRHRSGLEGFLYRKLRSREEAEDAVTITFAKAWRAREAFRGNASGKAWLYQIATRVALDILRRRRRRPAEQELDGMEPDLVGEMEAQVADPVELALERQFRAEAGRVVSDALGQLPEDERRLVSLHYFDGYNYDQISSLLGVTQSQVRGRLHRIRKRVRRDMVERQQWLPA